MSLRALATCRTFRARSGEDYRKAVTAALGDLLRGLPLKAEEN